MKEKQKHKDAFEHYYLQLHKGKSIDDSIVSVTEKFKISNRTAWRWKKEFEWDSKISIREIENTKTLEEKTNKTIVDNKVTYLSVVHASLNKYIEDVKKGKREPLPIESTKDIDTLIKLALLIQSQPTDITETTAKVDVRHKLDRLKRIEAEHDYRSDIRNSTRDTTDNRDETSDQGGGPPEAS